MPSIVSGFMGASAAKKAAKVQADAARYAADQQMAMFDKMQKNLAPYRELGEFGIGQMMDALPSLTARFNPTMEQLAQTPGYQFALEQGLQATQNGYAAAGLGQSGAALKGAAQYAQGLASQTYQQQFQNYLGQNQQIYNMLGGLVNTGQGAAAGTANMGMQAQTNASNFLTSGAAAQAAGIMGSANAWAGALGGAGNNMMQMMMMGNMFGGGGGAAGAAGAAGAGGGGLMAGFNPLMMLLM